ncbi:histone deacetylase HDT1-like isoform X2 [Silene latifolia]|uniref:histone deacetylase HDT1-like isoform X2 n=1 Tax=Silene latifolia TaxID=37657 RepID=UPI003D78797E
MAGQLQFWGIEVKPKEPCQVGLEDGSVVHISQATLGGEIKKDDETVTVYLKVGEKKMVLVRLSKKTPQMPFDLVFNENFEISHNWKNGCIHLMGYQTESVEFDSEIDSSDEEMVDSSDEELEDDVPIAKENGHLAASAAMPKAADKSKPEVEGESDDDSSDEEFDVDESEDEDADSEEDGTSVTESDAGEDESDDSEEETPAKVDTGKKRPNADAKTPPESKKAKIATPQKTDGKKGGQPTTPLASKKGGKTPGDDKTPKSGGSDVSCGSCKKTFKSGGALESHNKAKHGAK